MFFALSDPVKLTLGVCVAAILIALVLYGVHKHKI